jgi:hypothetical protein
MTARAQRGRAIGSESVHRAENIALLSYERRGNRLAAAALLRIGQSRWSENSSGT